MSSLDRSVINHLLDSSHGEELTVLLRHHRHDSVGLKNKKGKSILERISKKDGKVYFKNTVTGKLNYLGNYANKYGTLLKAGKISERLGTAAV